MDNYIMWTISITDLATDETTTESYFDNAEAYFSFLNICKRFHLKWHNLMIREDGHLQIAVGQDDEFCVKLSQTQLINVG